MVGLMSHIRTEIATNNAMPSGSMLLIELLLDILRHMFLYTVLLKRGEGEIYGLLLQLVLHVGALDDDFLGGRRWWFPIVGR